MKKLALALSIFALSAPGASAADLTPQTYSRAPAVVAPIYNWIGFYVGVNAGGAWNESHTTTTTIVAAGG